MVNEIFCRKCALKGHNSTNLMHIQIENGNENKLIVRCDICKSKVMEITSHLKLDSMINYE